jgi:hypothetical protein
MHDLERNVSKAASRAMQGEEILDHLTSARVRSKLIRAAERGDLPLNTIGPELVSTFPQATADLRVRQLAGLIIRMVLEQAGFVVERNRRIVFDAPPFKFGATFRRRPEAAEGDGNGLVERIVASLTPEEAELAYRLLGARLGVSRKGASDAR